jgi:pimeloyl-ACP methyl ester carboxylesterase
MVIATLTRSDIFVYRGYFPGAFSCPFAARSWQRSSSSLRHFLRWLLRPPHARRQPGRYDPVFDVAEVAALKHDVPKAEVHVLEAGHFALDESATDVAKLMRGFLGKLNHRAAMNPANSRT